MTAWSYSINDKLDNTNVFWCILQCYFWYQRAGVTILPHTVLVFPPHTKYWWHAVQVSLCGAGWSPGLVGSALAGRWVSGQEETSLVGHSACTNPPLSAAPPPPPTPSSGVAYISSAATIPDRAVQWELPPHVGATPHVGDTPSHGKDSSHLDTESLMITISVMIWSIGLYDCLELLIKW